MSLPVIMVYTRGKAAFVDEKIRGTAIIASAFSASEVIVMTRVTLFGRRTKDRLRAATIRPSENPDSPRVGPRASKSQVPRAPEVRTVVR